jgi:hypothetical protein
VSPGGRGRVAQPRTSCASSSSGRDDPVRRWRSWRAASSSSTGWPACRESCCRAACSAVETAAVKGSRAAVDGSVGGAVKHPTADRAGRFTVDYVEHGHSLPGSTLVGELTRGSRRPYWGMRTYRSGHVLLMYPREPRGTKRRNPSIARTGRFNRGTADSRRLKRASANGVRGGRTRSGPQRRRSPLSDAADMPRRSRGSVHWLRPPSRVEGSAQVSWLPRVRGVLTAGRRG